MADGEEAEGAGGRISSGSLSHQHCCGSVEEEWSEDDIQPLLPGPSGAQLIASDDDSVGCEKRQIRRKKGKEAGEASRVPPSLPGSVFPTDIESNLEITGTSEAPSANQRFQVPFLHASPRLICDNADTPGVKFDLHRVPSTAASAVDQTKCSSSEQVSIKARVSSRGSRAESCASILLEGEADVVTSASHDGGGDTKQSTFGTSSKRGRRISFNMLASPAADEAAACGQICVNSGEQDTKTDGERASRVLFSLNHSRSSEDTLRSSFELRRSSRESDKRRSSGEEGEQKSGGESMIESMLSVRRASKLPTAGAGVTSRKKLWGAVKRAAVAQVAAEGGLSRRTVSLSKNALSAVTSTLLGNGASTRPLRLADLQGRETWKTTESMQRALFLPAIESSFETLRETGGGFRDFGLAFYGMLFEQQDGDSLRDEVFNGESLEVLSLKLQSATAEMIRIAKMERPTDLASRMMELGLTHLEYGVKEAHLEPYKAATLDCLRRVIVGRGLKWTRTCARAWGWMLDLLGGLMMETLVEAGPKVARLRASWASICEELYADNLAGGSKSVPFLSQSSLLRSFNSCQTGPGSFSRKGSNSRQNGKHDSLTGADQPAVAEEQHKLGRVEGSRPLPMSPLGNNHSSAAVINDMLSVPTELITMSDSVTVRADATDSTTPPFIEQQPFLQDEITTTSLPAYNCVGSSSPAAETSVGQATAGDMFLSLGKMTGAFSERWPAGSDRELLLKSAESGVGREKSSSSILEPLSSGKNGNLASTPTYNATSLIGAVGITQKVNKVKEKLKVMVASSRDSIDSADGGKLMSLWSKAHSNGAANALVNSPQHREGRRLAGRLLLSVISTSDPNLRSLLMQQLYGRSESKAEESLGNALELLVHCATRPYLLRDKLRLLALRQIRMGLDLDVLETAEEILFEFLPLLLRPSGQWDAAMESAWRWIWNIVKTALTQHNLRSGQLLETLSNSWQLLESSGRGEVLAAKFYSRLFDAAGEKMAALFARPEKMQHAMFQRALGLLVESMQEPETIQTELESIAMKHIKCDITREHIDIFGTVLIACLKDELLSLGEEHWNADIARAWEDTFYFIAEVFQRVISSGSTNLVSRALAAGDADSLSTALSHSARSRRAAAAVEIRAAESTISPLLWTIRDGKLPMTEVLLRDVLAIRGDRANYYYGRDMLWEKHPGLVRLLVEKAPRLLTVLLDGHMWTSRFIENGKRRVNFYIRELYGNPSSPETKAVSSSMLGMFVYRLPMTELHLFTHPVTTFIVDLKWRLFARRSFFTMQLLNVANLCFATVYLQVGASSAGVSFSLALAQVLCATVRLAMYVPPLLRQLHSTSASSLRLRIPVVRISIRIPPAFHDVFVIINLLSGALCLTLFAYTWVADPFGWHALWGTADVAGDNSTLETWATVTAFTTGLLWIQIAELLKASTKLSALYYAMLAVIGDVIRFLMLLGLWATGFAFILYWLAVARFLHEGYTMSEALAVGVETGEGAGNMVYYMLMAFLGLAGLEEVLLESWLLRILFCVCVITSVVVLLNLLISTMVSTYDLLQRSCNELAVKSLAQLVVRAEESLPWERRRAHFESLHLDQPIEFDANDVGPAGGVQVVLPVEQLQHPAYKVLDRVERYAGTTDPRAVWAETDMTSQAVMEDCRSSTSLTKAMDTLLSETEARITAKLLLELDSIKSALGINDDGDSSEGEEGEECCSSDEGSTARKKARSSARRRRRCGAGKTAAKAE